ncbi:MAG: hypothetical protein A2X59_10140 [Nitrospirae bacterium GWC2_42_7]|nr:MAG: hypothetical protein A2X59_10140 [Nitrospirae bacterium GWC2_42_7]
MNFVKAILIVLIAVVFAAVAMDVAHSAIRVFEGKGQGKVIYSGDSHRKLGFVCTDCHPKIFGQELGKAEVSCGKDFETGKYCSACHNGTKAFSVKDPANCAKCHQK